MMYMYMYMHVVNIVHDVHVHCTLYMMYMYIVHDVHVHVHCTCAVHYTHSVQSAACAALTEEDQLIVQLQPMSEEHSEGKRKDVFSLVWS